MSLPRFIAAATTALAVAASALLVGAGAADATAKPPFTDPAAKGHLGFCNAQGKPVTSGSIDVHPFITRAVSSVASVKPYRAETGGKATVYAFQPRRGTEPSEWTGRQVTAASFYSNSAHPMAAGTELDYSLADFLSIYPAKWNGLVQLRMFLSAPNQPALLYPYTATTIKVTGSRWAVVDGGSVDCSSGKARSSEQTNLSAEQFQAQLTAVRKQRAITSAARAKSAGADGKSGKSGAAANGSGGSAGGATSAGASDGSSDSAANAANAANQQSTGGTSAVLWVVVALGVIVLLGLGLVGWQRWGRRIAE